MVRRMNGRHAWLFVLAALAFVAVAAPVSAQGIVQGVVKDAKGEPVDGAKVSIESTESNRKFETSTNKKGEFTQIGLQSGPYKVIVSKDKLTVQNTVTIRQGRPAVSNFILAPGSTAGMSPEMAAKNAELMKTFQEGVDAEKAGSHDDAIAKFTRVLELNPQCTDCYYDIGMSQAAKKDYEKAEAAFKKTIEMKPDSSEAYSGLANIYNAQRKFDQAQAASTKARELSGGPGALVGTGSADSLYNEGVILWNQGKIPDAKTQFEKAIAVNPNHAESHYQLAMALVNEGKLKEAGAEFETYLKLAPTGPNAAQAKALAAQLPK